MGSLAKGFLQKVLQSIFTSPRMLLMVFGPSPTILGSVPTTPDPNTSAKVSRYKWEAYRDINWWCIHYSLPKGGHTFAKVCHRNGRCIAILFKSIGIRGRFDAPEIPPSLALVIAQALLPKQQGWGQGGLGARRWPGITHKPPRLEGNWQRTRCTFAEKRTLAEK